MLQVFNISYCELCTSGILQATTIAYGLMYYNTHGGPLGILLRVVRGLLELKAGTGK